jgi:hypothetical protein
MPLLDDSSAVDKNDACFEDKLLAVLQVVKQLVKYQSYADVTKYADVC